MTIFTRVCQLSLFWARSISSMPFHCISYRSILILFSQLHHGVPNDLLQVSTKYLYVPLLPHTCMPCSSHSSAFGDLNNIWWGVQILELLIVHFPPVPCCILLGKFTSFFQHSVLEHLQPAFFPECERPSFRTYRIVVLSILICIQAATDICTLFLSWKHVLEYNMW